MYNFEILLFTKINRKKNSDVKIFFSLSKKLKETFLINGTISTGTSKVIFDLFISKEKSGIMLNDQFYNLSKGNILFLKETKKAKFKIKQIRFRKNTV